MRPDATAIATARPARIAYVIEDGPDGHQWLTEIISSCFSRSGGRQSLIAPLIDGVIPPRYAMWLRAFDPEVVYLVTYSNAQLVSTVAELVGDATIVECARNREGPQEHPHLRFERTPLTSLSWLPFLRTVSGNLRIAPEQILDAYPRWLDDGLVTDNFGTLIHGFGRWPLYTELSDCVNPLILTPTNPPPDRRIAGLGAHEEIADAYEVLDRISSRGKLVTVSQLSNLEPQPLSLRGHGWADSFCLVIGDTFLDRVSCWNAGLLHGDGRNQAFKTLRLPAAAIGNEERTRRVSEFLRKNNWINQQGGPRVTVRSHSIPADGLRQFADSLQTIYYNHVRSEFIASAEDCCPARIEDIRAGAVRELRRAETRLREASVSVAIPMLVQMGYARAAHPIFSEGYWCVDLQIDRLTTDTKYENRRETWVLSPRNQLAQEFHNTHPVRVLNGGELSLQIASDVSSVDIKQPTNETVLRIVLHTAEQYPYGDMRHAPPGRVAYQYSRPSDKGRYLQGVLGLFGSLTRAAQVLGNHFWRTQLQNMAAPSRNQYPEVIAQLQKRLQARDGQLTITDAEGWEALAKRVTEISSQLRIPRYVFQYEHLERTAIEEVGVAIGGDQHLSAQRDEILAELPSDLKSALASLCRLGVFHRGHGWSCRRCSHKNWRAVDRLANLVPCEVCHQEEQLPIDLNLSFRLNEFLATCLREHDTLSVLGALSALRESARSCFVYAPQTDLFRDYPDDRRAPVDRELDVLCLIDGRLTLGEAKATVNEIAATDIAALAGAANELMAGQAVLIAMEGDRARLDQKVQQLGSQLSAGIEAKGLLLSEGRWSNEPEWSLSVSTVVMNLFGG